MRSSMPPWPGMRLLESLALAWRLSTDSADRRWWPTPPGQAPQHRRPPDEAQHEHAKGTTKTSARRMPPQTPSQVFLGLMLAASLRLRSARPPGRRPIADPVADQAHCEPPQALLGAAQSYEKARGVGHI